MPFCLVLEFWFSFCVRGGGECHNLSRGCPPNECRNGYCHAVQRSCFLSHFSVSRHGIHGQANTLIFSYERVPFAVMHGISEKEIIKVALWMTEKASKLSCSKEWWNTVLPRNACLHAFPVDLWLCTFPFWAHSRHSPCWSSLALSLCTLPPPRPALY